MIVTYHKTFKTIDSLRFKKDDVVYLKILWGNDIRHPKTSNAVVSMFCINWTEIHVVNHIHDEFYKLESDSFFYKINDKLKRVDCKFIHDLKKSFHLHEGFIGEKYNDLHIFNFNKNGEDPTYHPIENVLFNKERNSVGLNIIIPLVKHVQNFQEYVETIKNFSEIGELREPGYRSLVDRILPFLYNIEKHGIFCDKEVLQKFFGHEKLKFLKGDYIYNDYNIFSLTGRPSNSIHNINFAALKKENGERAFIKTRYGKDGMLILVDFSAYHPHLLSNLMNFKFPVFNDFYDWLAAQMKEFSGGEDENLKGEIFTQLYGKIDQKYLKIPYFFEADKFIKSRWNFYRNNDYIDTPIFNRSIKYVEGAHPNKVVNYLLQAYETEKNCVVMEKLYSYLNGKLTIPILYGYDSILFDAHKIDGMETLKEIKILMEEGGFPVKIKVGSNFCDMVKVKL